MTISLSRSAMSRPPADPQATCALHTYLTLPSAVFADKYQLSTNDPLFLESHSLAALRAVSGETDLEAPEWMVNGWGSSWLLELATPSDGLNKSSTSWDVTIPLHLRYLAPSKSGYRQTKVPWPVVFWACTAEEGTKMAASPFDRVNLGWEGIFGPRTMFYQVNPSKLSNSTSTQTLMEELKVPVLKIQGEWGIFGTKTIEMGTVAVILLGTLWILVKLGLIKVSKGGGGEEGEEERPKRKKRRN